MKFSITFRNGDFRNLNLTRKELLSDLKYMRKKWDGIEVCVGAFDEDRIHIKSKYIKL